MIRNPRFERTSSTFYILRLTLIKTELIHRCKVNLRVTFSSHWRSIIIARNERDLFVL